jgi:hypothetical protein
VWQRLGRLAFVALFGLALTLGVFQSQQMAQQSSPVQVADPGGNSGNGG